MFILLILFFVFLLKIRITYDEALEILAKSGKCEDLRVGQSLNNSQEQLLVELFDFTPVFVTHFPANIKPFYMKQKDGKVSLFIN